MKKILELKNISYSYFGQIKALDKISLDVHEGELLCIMGQNGSGKTTLLHIMNGLIIPDSGGVFFKGKEINEKSLRNPAFNYEFRQSSAYVFQNPYIQLFCNNVFEDLLFAPLQLGVSQEEAEKRVTEIMSFIEIEHLKYRPILSLSGGEKKKVAIASALILNPDLILFDEPLSGLDPKTQNKIINLLKELHNSGKTIVFTTHNIDLIKYLQPRIAIISHNHTIIKIEETESIINDEDFLSSINII